MSVSQDLTRNKNDRVRAGENGGYLEKGGGNINSYLKPNLELKKVPINIFGCDHKVKTGDGGTTSHSPELSKGPLGKSRGSSHVGERDKTKWKQVVPGSPMAKAMIDEVVSKCTVENGLYPGEEVENVSSIRRKVGSQGKQGG